MNGKAPPPLPRLLFVFSLALLLPARGAVAGDKDAVLLLNLRTRVEAFKESGDWTEITLRKQIPARETAIIICDMWDKHWCPSASKRCDALAQKMAAVITAAQAKGIPVIHAPSECMEFYKDTPQRRKILQVPRVPPPTPLVLSDPPL